MVFDFVVFEVQAVKLDARISGRAYVGADGVADRHALGGAQTVVDEYVAGLQPEVGVAQDDVDRAFAFAVFAAKVVLMRAFAGEVGDDVIAYVGTVNHQKVHFVGLGGAAAKRAGGPARRRAARANLSGGAATDFAHLLQAESGAHALQLHPAALLAGQLAAAVQVSQAVVADQHAEGDRLAALGGYGGGMRVVGILHQDGEGRLAQLDGLALRGRHVFKRAVHRADVGIVEAARDNAVGEGVAAGAQHQLYGLAVVGRHLGEALVTQLGNVELQMVVFRIVAAHRLAVYSAGYPVVAAGQFKVEKGRAEGHAVGVLDVDVAHYVLAAVIGFGLAGGRAVDEHWRAEH